MDDKKSIIEMIIEIELEMFMNVPAEGDADCRNYPEDFKLHREAQLYPWSEDTLGSYLEDLREAERKGLNLMTVKYARMDHLLPYDDPAPVFGSVLRIMCRWQEEMFQKYPAIMAGARDLSGENGTMTSFETYLKGELSTYSEKTLTLLHRDIKIKREQMINMSEEVYGYLAKAAGYASVNDLESALKQRK